MQSQDVPVIRISHLLAKLTQVGQLKACADWLQDRAYLPTEGTHYKVVEVEASIGGWILEWYGMCKAGDSHAGGQSAAGLRDCDDGDATTFVLIVTSSMKRDTTMS